MKLFLRSTTLACTLLLGLTSTTWGASLESMDEVLTRNGSLKAFLADKQLVEAYYREAAEYFGPERFPKDSYLEMIKQVKELIKKEPKLAKRLWETQGIGEAFELQSAIKTSGRDLSIKNWNKYFTQWQKTLEGSSQAMTHEKAVAIGKQWSEKSAEFENYTPQEGRSKADFLKAKGEFYRSLKDSPDIRSASSYLILEKLKTEEIKDLLNSGDADLVLDTLREHKTNPALYLGEIDPDASSALSAGIKNLIPSQDELLSNTHIFKIKKVQTRKRLVKVAGSGESVIESKPVPRRFHGLWKGFPIKECVGGGEACELTPRRWGTAAIKDAQVYYLEKDGSHLGFVQLVPIERGGKTYASIDLGAPVLRQKTFTRDPETGTPIASTLAEVWIEKKSASLPKNWEGIVQSESDAIGNAGVLDTVRGSDAYIFGKKLPLAKSFKVNDPLTQPFKDWKIGSYNYSKGMIFDAGVESAGNLVLLDPGAARRVLQDKDISALAKRLSKASPAQKVAILNYATKQKIADEAFSWVAAQDIGNPSSPSGAAIEYFAKVKPQGPKTKQVIMDLIHSENNYSMRQANIVIAKAYANVPRGRLKDDPLKQNLIANLKSGSDSVIGESVATLTKLFPNDPEVIQEVTQALIRGKDHWCNETTCMYEALAVLKRDNPTVEQTYIELIRKNIQDLSDGRFRLEFHTLIKSIEAYQTKNPEIYSEILKAMQLQPFDQFASDSAVSALVHAPKEAITDDVKKGIQALIKRMDQMVAKTVPDTRWSKEKMYYFGGVGFSEERINGYKTALQIATGELEDLSGKLADKICPSLYSKYLRKRRTER